MNQEQCFKRIGEPYSKFLDKQINNKNGGEDMARSGKTIIVGISMPKELLAKIKLLAKKENRSISNFISNALSFLMEDSCNSKK